ncbi:unnamed protein product [Vitrella brassicaformis CCMP3155]|uniref:Protein kinase domain-containing protein n=1 Tax=Vitrella brassicaformis (strain CCMP3155) TaxID=1169540 RepID=A0A0G4H841_VITBC|nr:unnamed protein product [Vitrella brassicaformis CCMP3155]|eukprot:CEM39903.1 unnamed protein product [Vitrella brassicaformis CCMP3155]
MASAAHDGSHPATPHNPRQQQNPPQPSARPADHRNASESVQQQLQQQELSYLPTPSMEEPAVTDKTDKTADKPQAEPSPAPAPKDEPTEPATVSPPNEDADEANDAVPMTREGGNGQGRRSAVEPAAAGVEQPVVIPAAAGVGAARGRVVVEDAQASIRTKDGREPMKRRLTQQQWEDVVIECRRAVAKAVESTTLCVDSTIPTREGLHGFVEVLYDTTTKRRLAYKIFKHYECDGRDEEGFVINGWDLAAAVDVQHDNVIAVPRTLKVRSRHATVKVVVMAFCNGGTLADDGFVDVLGEEREPVLMPLLRQALQGLLHLHSKRLCHTDMLGAEDCPGGNLALSIDTVSREGRLVIIDLDRMEQHEEAEEDDFRYETKADSKAVGFVFDHLLGDRKSEEGEEIVHRLKGAIYRAEQAVEEINDYWMPKHGHRASTKVDFVPLPPLPKKS